MRPTYLITRGVGLLLAGASTSLAEQQTYRLSAQPAHSGTHQGRGIDAYEAFSTTIEESAAAWMRLEFGDYDLGTASFVSITSLDTGHVQDMTAAALDAWGGRTAFFGGERLNVRLFVAPADRDVFFEIERVWVGGGVQDDTAPGHVTRDLCGGDSRTTSNDPRVARLFLGGGCTAWIASNGAFVTAGHCVDQDPDQGGPGLPDGMIDPGFLADVVEFNVPPSLANGQAQPAAPSDQYPVNGILVTYQFAGMNSNFNSIGADWAVFSVGPNANGETPQIRQGAFFRVSQAEPEPGETIRVTGCGLDWTPAGIGGPAADCCDFDRDGICNMICNAQNLVQQTATGPYYEFNDEGSGRISHIYQVDTTAATSGGPVIRESNGEAIGINTNSGCVAVDGNFGTSMRQGTLDLSLNQFYGPNSVYVDAAAGDGWGSVAHPYNTVGEAVLDAPQDAVICIVPGDYPASELNTFDTNGKTMKLIAPFGGVRIGN